MVSILVPVFNVESYLTECIESILSQDYKPLQVVLIDDGSIDKSWDICQSYLSKDSRIEAYHQSNQGVAVTRNHLLEKAKGDYVLFVDADDWIEKETVCYLVDLLESTNADLAMCDKVINDAKPSRNPPVVFELDRERAVFDFLQHEYFVGSLWNKLFRRCLLHDEQFHGGVSYGEDALFCWGVLKKVDKIVVSNKQLYHYRMNLNSISHSFGEKKFTAYEVWEEITRSTESLYPNLLPYAQAHFCVSMTMVLYNAAQNGYKYDDKVKKLLSIVKKYKNKMLFYSKRPYKKYIMATMLSHNYKLARKILHKG